MADTSTVLELASQFAPKTTIRFDFRTRETIAPHQSVEHEPLLVVRDLTWVIEKPDEYWCRVEPIALHPFLRELAISTKDLLHGWTFDELVELCGIGTRWHLNSMRGACAHQAVSTTTQGRRTASPCPVSGYRYGSAWLAEPLEAGVEERVAELFGAHR